MMFFVLCTTFLLSVCQLSYSLGTQQPTYLDTRTSFQNPQSIYVPTPQQTPQQNFRTSQNAEVKPNRETPRRNKYYSVSRNDGQKQKEKIWRFELDVPEVLEALRKYTGVSISDAKVAPSNSLRTKDSQSILGQKIKFEIKPPNIPAMIGYLNDLVNIHPARRYIFNGWVRELPGAVKSETVEYPPRYEEGRLMNLLRLKKKRKTN